MVVDWKDVLGWEDPPLVTPEPATVTPFGGTQDLTTPGTPITDVLLVLDRSGSMASGGQSRERGSKWTQLVNLARLTIDELQADTSGMLNRVSVIVLDDVVQPITVWKTPAYQIDCAGILAGQAPGGDTPLFDAIGTGVTRLSTEDDYVPNHAYLVQIFTDGIENASTHYRGPALNHRIQRLQETGRWTFTWMIAAADLRAARSAFGSMPAENFIAIPNTAAGFAAGAEKNRSGLKQFLLARHAGSQQTQRFYLTAGK